VVLPFRSLRFPSSDVQTWGIGFFRIIARNNESDFWPRVTHKVDGFCQQLANGEGMKGISPGRNVQFIPYATFGRSRALDSRDTPSVFRKEWEKRVGLDAKIVLKDALTLDVAINPDFSQVESDDPQVTVNQRFEVFFPEKRPFFIENASFFQTPFTLFFSRRIGDPQIGARLTGKVDGWTIGALVADDRGPGESVADTDPLSGERALFGVVRANREFKNQSSIGVMFTDREFGGGFNRVGSMDFRWKLDKNWVANGQAVASSTRNTDGSYQAGPGYNAGLNRNGRSLGLFFAFQDLSPGFVTQTGFIPRVDIRETTDGFGYTFHPEGKHLISWSINSNVDLIFDHSGLRLERNFYNTVSFSFRRNTNFGFIHNQFRERLRPVDFPVLGAPLDFGRHATGMFFNTDAFKKFSFGTDARWPSRINYNPPAGKNPYLANVFEAGPTLTIRPTGRLRIDNSYLISRMTDRGPAAAAIFNNHIARSKWNWQFNREFSFRMIMQYSTVLANPAYTSIQTTKNANADFLLTWLLHPGTAAYIGYNSNLQNLDPTGNFPTARSFINDGRTAFVKVSWMFRY
jgi:hypothetical protein